MRTRGSRGIAILSLVQLAACATWRPTTGDPRQVMVDEQPGGIRVTRMTGEQVTLWRPELRADSVTGSTGAGSVTVPLADVSRLEIRESNLGRTMGFVGIVFAAVIALAVAGWAAESGSF